MKSMLIKTAGFAMWLATVCVVQAQGPYPLQLLWGSQETGFNADGEPDIIRPDGTPVPVDSTWAAQIVLASDPSVVLYTAHHHPDYGFWAFVGDPGVAFQAAVIPPSASGMPIMTRIFNDPNPLNATMFADAGVITFTWDPYGLPPIPKDYDFGTVPQSAWQVIPEPGSAALLALGAGGAVLVRRWRRRLDRD